MIEKYRNRLKEIIEMSFRTLELKIFPKETSKRGGGTFCNGY